MTAEEVLNVHNSKEISDNGNEDHSHNKIVTEHCNGDVRDNGNVGGEIDSVNSDPIVTVENNGAVLEDHKVEGDYDDDESKVTVTENDCGEESSVLVSNDSVDENCETTTVEGEICQNGSGSDENGALDKESNECTVENLNQNEIREEVTDSVVEVEDRELESVVVQNGVVAENEISADVDKSGRQIESVAVENGAVDNEIEVPVVVEEVDADVSTDEVEESVDSDVVGKTESIDHEIVESENVSDEKNEICDVELETVVDGEVSESVEKNEISVDVNGVSENTDLKEGAVEEDTRNGLENVSVESVSDTIVENGLAEVEENVIPVDAGESERSVEVSEPQVVLEAEAEPSVVTREIENVKEESEVESSDNVVKGEGESIEVSETKNDVVVNEVEASMETVVESEAEPSNNVVEREAEPSLEAVESEAEVSNNVVQSEAEPSTEAIESEAEVSNNVVQSEADSSVDVQDLKTDAAESEAEPSSVEAEPSAEGEGSNQTDEVSRASEEASATNDAVDEQEMITEVVRKPFYYLIRVPRYDDDENIKEQIQRALQQVEEKTKLRDEIRAESQTKKAIVKEYGQEFRAAVQEERAARDLLKSKRKEMDSVQSTMNRLNNAISVGDIDGKIRNMEHMIQHETLPLKEEKQLIRQIKQLKQNRDELSNIIAKQDHSQSLEDKDSIEEQSKQLQLLRKELDALRNNVQKSEAITKAAKKKYDDESNQLSEVMARFKAADDTRQEAFVKLQTLKRQLHEKSKYFWEYKNASTRGQELGAQGKKEELQSLCINQAEGIHEMWKNDEFRRNYLRCNTRSTLRRLITYDGRSLGPDEEPPVIPAYVERASKNDSLVSRSTPEQHKKPTPTESVTVNTKDEPASKVVVQKPEISQTTKAKKPAKPAPSSKKSVVPVPRWGDESDEDTSKEPKEPVRTKEEEERILKAEMARKEEEEAKLKEMKRLEDIEKAKEALQRKKRNAEKAQQRALYKAQKEAEQKEKEREKRARKKGKRNAVSTESVVENTEQDSAASPSSEILTKTAEECEQSEKPVEVTKRSVKPSQFTKQNKVKSLPMAIRNRGKRRIQPWMWWVLIAVLVIAALFYIGNNSSLSSSFQSFGF